MITNAPDAMSADELKRRRNRTLFYRRLKHWVILSSLAVALINFVRLFKHRDLPLPVHTVPCSQSAGSQAVEGNSYVTYVTDTLPVYDYSKMIQLMEDYLRYTSDTCTKFAFGSESYQQLEKLLSQLLEQEKSYLEYLQKVRQLPLSVFTRRQRRATGHYLSSLEQAIMQLQKMVGSDQGVGLFPAG